MIKARKLILPEAAGIVEESRFQGFGIRPQPRSRVLEFWQQPRRCHVCVQSRMRRGRLQLGFPRLWPRFRCEEEFLTISNGRKARRGCTALFGSRLDHHAGETCVLQLATDQCRIVVAVRRACQKARRIVRKNLCESIRHIIRKYILLDAIPYVEQKMSSGLQDRFASR